MWAPGVLGIQVVWRTKLNGPKRVANTAQGLHPLQRDLGPWSSGEEGLARAARSSSFREFPAGRPRSGGGEAPAGKQVRPVPRVPAGPKFTLTVRR